MESCIGLGPHQMKVAKRLHIRASDEFKSPIRINECLLISPIVCVQHTSHTKQNITVHWVISGSFNSLIHKGKSRLEITCLREVANLVDYLAQLLMNLVFRFHKAFPAVDH